MSLAFFLKSEGQNKYWVFLADKNGVDFNPQNYFDRKAIERRIKSGIPLFDSTDFPLRKDYLEILAENVETISSTSRWFNAVAVSADYEQINKIQQLTFVKSVKPMFYKANLCSYIFDTLISEDDNKLAEMQLNRMEGDVFYKRGYTGKGIRIAVFDAGFPSVDKSPAFKHLRDNNRIIKTWDFARKKENVYAHNQHGTMVLSCIAGKLNQKRFGLATDAEFLLARTEVDAENYSEEENWLQAVEWADKNGADIISSSLAYTYHRYYTFQMDGETSLVAKAANLAANKGILVINAMGNDGNNEWKIMATPADADSVLSVGAISPYTNYHASFSSFGPTSNFKMKPNVVAVGKVIAASKNEFKKVKGTSFSAPLIAGFAACTWQSQPFLTNMQLFEKIEESADLFPYYDYAHGYGAPLASKILNLNEDILPKETFLFIKDGDSLSIIVNEEFIKTKGFNNSNYLYYHFENNDGYLEQYWLVDVYQTNAAVINLKDFGEQGIIRAHYKGFTLEFKVD
ncbi:MAG: S8 family serine peptidase [Bacteroidales bacterium]|nr:S8 family serine peptidase [Bacteroidales bacterium]